jgi:hypothetical protein
MEINWAVLMSETGAETVPWRRHGDELRTYYETEDGVGHELELAQDGNEIALHDGWSTPDAQRESPANIVILEPKVFSHGSRGSGSPSRPSSVPDQDYLRRLWKYASSVADNAAIRGR